MDIVVTGVNPPAILATPKVPGPTSVATPLPLPVVDGNQSVQSIAEVVPMGTISHHTSKGGLRVGS